jgi:hypothetical protein
LGRDITNDIVINDPEVSRHHCRITIKARAHNISDVFLRRRSLSIRNCIMRTTQNVSKRHKAVTCVVLRLPSRRKRKRA